MARAEDVEAIWAAELAGLEAWSLVLRWRDLEVDVRGDLAYSGASMIKTFLLEQASVRLAWDQRVTVTPGHVAAGDGVLATWPLPVTLPLHAVAQLMTALSDNTATNVVVDVLGGLEAVNDTAPPGLGLQAAAPDSSASNGSILRRWWFWTAVGGALALAGGAVYYATGEPRLVPPSGSVGTLDRSR